MENLNLENVEGFGFLYGTEDSDDVFIACIDSSCCESPIFIWKPWGKDLDISLPICFWSSEKTTLWTFLKGISFLQSEKDNLDRLLSPMCVPVPLKKDLKDNSIWIG